MGLRTGANLILAKGGRYRPSKLNMGKEPNGLQSNIGIYVGATCRGGHITKRNGWGRRQRGETEEQGQRESLAVAWGKRSELTEKKLMGRVGNVPISFQGAKRSDRDPTAVKTNGDEAQLPEHKRTFTANLSTEKRC